MKKAKVIEIRHKVAPTPEVVNPLQSQINDLNERLARFEATFNHENDELWSVLRDGEWITRLKV